VNLGLQGRTALVLGASSGLGLASAQALHEEGANVVMFARRGPLLRTEAARLGATPVVGDIRSADDLEAAVDTCVSAHGGLDVVVLNGGGPPLGAARDLTDESVVDAFDLLMRPVVRLIGAALPHLRASGQGRIVSISSVSVREPIPGLALSNAIRPGVWGYLRTLARELGPDAITVNSVAPGTIATTRLTDFYGDEPPAPETAAIPLGRFGAPAEVGAVVCFLASAQASYLSGCLIPVDGGASRSL
jgi:3-oxoacyl-[acyl-carrier protein] reductase